MFVGFFRRDTEKRAQFLEQRALEAEQKLQDALEQLREANTSLENVKRDAEREKERAEEAAEAEQTKVTYIFFTVVPFKHLLNFIRSKPNHYTLPALPFLVGVLWKCPTSTAARCFLQPRCWRASFNKFFQKNPFLLLKGTF